MRLPLVTVSTCFPGAGIPRLCDQTAGAGAETGSWTALEEELELAVGRLTTIYVSGGPLSPDAMISVPGEKTSPADGDVIVIAILSIPFVRCEFRIESRDLNEWLKSGPLTGEFGGRLLLTFAGDTSKSRVNQSWHDLKDDGR